ncbi:MAG: SGNH/GDSL hydrolase family protein [Anaerolineae bacterium]
MANNQKPLGIIAIGHSGLTGESSDPSRLGQDAPENSWATGTNPAVNSIYQRLVAVEPEAEGHVANLAEGGAVARQLANQAKQALQLVPAPQLVIIQTIDNDIRCDGSDDKNIPIFGDTLTKALDSIVAATPNSRILMVSQPGRPAGFAAAVASNPAAKDKYEGNGICDLFNLDGSINQDHINTLTSIIERYEAEQERVCAAFPQCSTDHGALTKYKDNLGDLAGDWTHLAVRGHTQLAELIWPIVAQELGVK